MRWMDLSDGQNTRMNRATNIQGLTTYGKSHLNCSVRNMTITTFNPFKPRATKNLTTNKLFFLEIREEITCLIAHFKIIFHDLLSIVRNIGNAFSRDYFCWQKIIGMMATSNIHGRNILVDSSKYCIRRHRLISMNANPIVNYEMKIIYLQNKIEILLLPILSVLILMLKIECYRKYV